jgi:myosin-crossreactive antigen
MAEKKFFTLNMYEALAIGFLSFISLHVYNISLNQAVHKVEFSSIKEQVIKNTIQINHWMDQNRFPPKEADMPKIGLLPDRRKIHSNLLKGD